MLTSNLLPPKEKKLVQYEERRLILRFFALGVATALVVGSILLLPSFWSLTIEKKELDRALTLEKGAAANFKIRESLAEILSLKNDFLSINNYLSAQRRASLILDNLLAEGDEGIDTQNITVNKNNNIVISGNARARHDLLNLEKRWRDSGYFQELSTPVPVKEFDISFLLQGKLKPMHGL